MSGIDPGADEARSALRRELMRPEYQDRDVVRRILDRLERLVADGVAAASQASLLQTLVAMLVLLALAAAVVWLLTRAHRAGRVRTAAAGVLTEERWSADQLRARAEAALTELRYDDALVDGFRALARRQVELGRLPDDPGATAAEVAASVASTHPDRAAEVLAGALAFDAVVYGGRPATEAQARSVLGLDRSMGRGLVTAR